MTLNIFVLKGALNGKIVVVRFFFCWVYIDIALLVGVFPGLKPREHFFYTSNYQIIVMFIKISLQAAQIRTDVLSVLIWIPNRLTI